MSRTDKTDPIWVHEMRYGKEHHNHGNGICDLASDQKQSRWRYQSCYRGIETFDTRYWNWYYEAQEYANHYERGERRRIKNVLARGDWDNDVLDYKPRNSAKWNCW